MTTRPSSTVLTGTGRARSTQKTVSKLLSAEQVPDYAEWLANRHRLRDLVHELEELGIAALEADPRTPRRARKTTSP